MSHVLLPTSCNVSCLKHLNAVSVSFCLSLIQNVLARLVSWHLYIGKCLCLRKNVLTPSLVFLELLQVRLPSPATTVEWFASSPVQQQLVIEHLQTNWKRISSGNDKPHPAPLWLLRDSGTMTQVSRLTYLLTQAVSPVSETYEFVQQAVYRPDALPVAQATLSKHWTKGKSGLQTRSSCRPPGGFSQTAV